MSFSPQQLLESIRRLPEAGRYWIGFSGGMDSTVLLHALARLKAELDAPISVIHVDHGLSSQSVEWSEACEEVCKAHGLPYEIKRVDAQPKRGESPEAAARNARYEAILSLIGKGEMLLTAHHQDDQAETLLLQLLRGAGPHGLAAMPSFRPFGDGWLGRPLLDFNRSELVSYAEAEGLEWIDDPSNFDTGLERNFLRHQLLPLLKERRGEIGTVLARSAEHFAEAAMLLDTLADADLETLTPGEEGSLPITLLLTMEEARLRNLLRYWMRQQGIPLPDSNRLERVVDEVLMAAEDGQPLVEWQGAEVRRYRDRLFIMPPLPPEPVVEPIEWQRNNELELPDGLGRLLISDQEGAGIRSEQWTKGEVTVRFRQGGERCVPAGRGQHHALKKLLQEEGVPPWWRSRWPMVYIDDELAALPGLFVCESFAAGTGEKGIGIDWADSGAIANSNKKKQNM